MQYLGIIYFVMLVTSKSLFSFIIMYKIVLAVIRMVKYSPINFQILKPAYLAKYFHTFTKLIFQEF